MFINSDLGNFLLEEIKAQKTKKGLDNKCFKRENLARHGK